MTWTGPAGGAAPTLLVSAGDPDGSPGDGPVPDHWQPTTVQGRPAQSAVTTRRDEQTGRTHTSHLLQWTIGRTTVLIRGTDLAGAEAEVRRVAEGVSPGSLPLAGGVLPGLAPEGFSLLARDPARIELGDSQDRRFTLTLSVNTRPLAGPLRQVDGRPARYDELFNPAAGIWHRFQVPLGPGRYLLVTSTGAGISPFGPAREALTLRQLSAIAAATQIRGTATVATEDAP